MGVTGLWTILQPCARPIKLETLNKKRLAVDASIWIYQFLKAVRDKEGNALRNSHVIGFFRRICKLLFFGIKPVFVFDGGAPTLKRQTISNRKRRREGRRDDAVRTAGKLLAVQMQRRAEEDAEKRRNARQRPAQDDEEEPVPENPVYVEQIHMTTEQRQATQKFKKTDAYHLPELSTSFESMGAPNDPRIMSQEELEEYARQFHAGEDINLYDFSKIDFDSSFFVSLPASDRYNILNAARLRSRLRMGYSKDQLDTMFKDRMAFSRFQVDRVRERNELTQRLMNINGMNGDLAGVDGVGRIAGEKGREYVLVKNEGVEGGWALGVVSDKNEGKREKPINVDAVPISQIDDNDWEDEDEFEDVPIEGLNRLPKNQAHVPTALQKKASSSQKTVKPSTRRYSKPKKANGLFVAEDEEDDGEDWEDALFEEPRRQVEDADDAAELDRAIAMSLEEGPEEDEPQRSILDDLPQQRAPDSKPFAKGSGRSIAHFANNRSNHAAPAPYRTTQEKDNDPMDFQSVLAASQRAKHQVQPQLAPPAPPPSKSSTEVDQASGSFGGPLPFEKLSLGSSLFGKKNDKEKPQEPGGFEAEDADAGTKIKGQSGKNKKEKEPLPPWFTGDIEQDMNAQKAIEAQAEREHEMLQQQDALDREDAVSIIDVDMSDAEEDKQSQHDESRHSEKLQVELANDSLFVQSDGDEPEPTVPARRTEGRSSEELWPETPPKTADEEPVAHDPIDAGLNYQQSQDDAPQPDRNGGIGSKHSSPPASDFEDVLPPQVHETEQPPAPAAATDTIGDAPVPPASLDHLDTFDQQKSESSHSENEYSDPEDEELFAALAAEADEHARFAASLNENNVQSAADYERELKSLRNQQKKDRRDADEVTQIMITECQQLLKLFGLPYVTAPMEAEAQCAELVQLGLVDGIVTDDSDVFLFGGTRVYKNMFNQAKFVECYLATDLEREFALDRQRLIRIAHLLGSDYTEGLPSVGPVTALELVSEFDDLEAFRDWWTTVQSTPPTREAAKNEPTPFRRKFRKNAARIFLPPVFPDTRVDQAYLEPETDSDPSPFAWGVPDLVALREFLMATIGWSAERTDEVLVPVIRDMNSRAKEGTQSNITSFFSGSVGVGAAPKRTAEAPQEEGFAPRRRLQASKRMQGALGRLKEQAERQRKGSRDVSNEESAEADADDEEPVTASSPKAGPKGKKRKKATSAAASAKGSSSDGDSDNSDYAEKLPKKKGRGRKRSAKAKS